jgi:HSP20 family molecular chaperone IbpA
MPFMPGKEDRPPQARQPRPQGLNVRPTALFLLFAVLSLPAQAYDPDPNSYNNNAYNTEQAKEDYRAFLKKLKELNSQYKSVTGEMAQVIKEEGVPTWDAGDLGKQMDEIFPQEATVSNEGVAIKDSEKELVVTIDLPGIQKKTLKTSVQDGNKLSVKAEKKTAAETKKIERLIQLPAYVDPKSAKAKYQDGVLTLRLAKSSHQEIPISVA